MLQDVGRRWIGATVGEKEVTVVFDAATGRFEEKGGEVFVEHVKELPAGVRNVVRYGSQGTN